MPEPTSPQPGQQQPQKPASKDGGIGAVVLHHTVTALMLALIIALGVWAYLTFRKTNFFEPADARSDTRVEAYALDAQVQRIHFALRVYFRLDGRYPTALSDLAQRGLLLPSDLYYPSGDGRYVYSRSASGYTLELQPSD